VTGPGPVSDAVNNVTDDDDQTVGAV
jgi:hypothetical protein